MSVVANVMLSVDVEDVANANAFGKWLLEKPYKYFLRQAYSSELAYPWPDDQEWPGPHSGTIAESPKSVWPGTKMPECHVFLGVLDYADLDKVREQFAAWPWRQPNAIQLFLKDQEEFLFRVWMLRDGALYQLPLPPGPSEDDDDFWLPS